MTEHSKIAKRTGGDKFAPGTSGNPAGRPPGKPMVIREMTRAFADEHGEFLLDVLRGHAMNKPEIALALADRVFGPSDWSGHGISAMLGPLESLDDCEDARDRVLSAYARGSIDFEQCERLEALIFARRQRMARSETIEAEFSKHNGEACN